MDKLLRDSEPDHCLAVNCRAVRYTLVILLRLILAVRFRPWQDIIICGHKPGQSPEEAGIDIYLSASELFPCEEKDITLEEAQSIA